jgi:hypothetical protein
MKSLEKVFAGTVIVSSLLFGGVSKLTMADVIAVSSHPGVVRIYNPQEFSQSGTVRVTPLGQVPSSNDVVIPYDLPAHNVENVAVEAGLVRVTPDGTSPNPVVDFETNPDGGIASPALFTDLTTKHTTGNGTGNALIISKDGGPVVVSQYANGKPSSATTLATTSGTAFSTPVNGTFSVDFLNGSGAVAFENGEQRAINASGSLLSTTAYWWAKPSTVVLKPTRLEMEEIIAADSALFAAFVAKDSTFLAKYGSVDGVAQTLTYWVNNIPADGELSWSTPIKVVGDKMYLIVSSSTDVDGLTAKKIPSGDYKISVNVPGGRAMMLALLGREIERNPTLYYSTVDPSTRPNATWAKQKMNKSITAAAPLAVDEAQLVPYVTPDTTITLTNSSPWTTTYTVSTAAMGSDPRTGASQSFTLAPGQTQTLENLVTQEGSAYIKTNGSKPVVSAERPGLDIPVVDEEYANNTKPQAGIIVDGANDREIFLSGNVHGWNNTINSEARGPSGDGPAYGDVLHLVPATISIGKIGDLYHLGLPENSSNTMIPQSADESKAAMLMLYENSATLDQRIQKGQDASLVEKPKEQVAKEYVAAWIPAEGRVRLNNYEARGMINGDGKGTPGYSTDIAAVLVNSSGANGRTVNQLAQWLKDDADCNMSNGELCNSWDPLSWNNSEFGVKGFYLLQHNCDDNAGFPLGATDMQVMYSLIKDQFLWRYVMNNPDLYGGSSDGLPSMDHDPLWYTNDPNDFTCP